jgi:hypothetical protein
LPTRHRQLYELYGRSGYVKSQKRAILSLQEEHFLFPFQDVTPENDRPISILEALYISAKLN